MIDCWRMHHWVKYARSTSVVLLLQNNSCRFPALQLFAVAANDASIRREHFVRRKLFFLPVFSRITVTWYLTFCLRWLHCIPLFSMQHTTSFISTSQSCDVMSLLLCYSSIHVSQSYLRKNKGNTLDFFIHCAEHNNSKPLYSSFQLTVTLSFVFMIILLGQLSGALQSENINGVMANFNIDPAPGMDHLVSKPCSQ